MRVKCKACGGVYEQQTRDGMRYFHACAPLTRLRVRHQDGTIATVDGQAPDGSTVLEERFVTRPNHRNENLDRAKVRARTPQTKEDDLMIATGAGVEPAPAEEL